MAGSSEMNGFKAASLTVMPGRNSFTAWTGTAQSPREQEKPDLRLGTFQKSALEYLINHASADGTVIYNREILREHAGTQNLYDIFRQFYLKGIIESMPERLEPGVFAVRLKNMASLRQYLDAPSSDEPAGTEKDEGYSEEDDEIFDSDVSVPGCVIDDAVKSALIASIDSNVLRLLGESRMSMEDFENMMNLAHFKRLLLNYRPEDMLISVAVRFPKEGSGLGCSLK